MPSPPLNLSGTPVEHLRFSLERFEGHELWHAAVAPGTIDDAAAVVRERAAAVGLRVMIWSHTEGDGLRYFREFFDDPPLDKRPPLVAQAVLTKHRELLEARSIGMVRFLSEHGFEGATLEGARRQAPSVLERELAGVTAPRSDEPPMNRAEAWEFLNREWEGFGSGPMADPLLVVFPSAAEPFLLELIVQGGELQPDYRELAPVFATWQSRFGATLGEWNGSDLCLHVERPPRDLEEARSVALEFFVMCPGNSLGRATTPDSAETRLTEIMSNRWMCRWFEE